MKPLKCQLSEEALVSEGKIVFVGEDQVVKDGQFKQLAGLLELAGEFPVGLAGSKVARGMVMG